VKTRKSQKYEPLKSFLAEQPPDVSRVVLDFEQLSRLIGEQLPSSAYIRGAWWGNETNPRRIPSYAWTTVGWHANADRSKQMVEFVRV
jgi:hypothetical protein